MKDQGFLLCLPLSRTAEGVKSIKAKCCICNGSVGINPNNNFEKVPVEGALRPICGSCMVDLVDGGEECTGAGIASTSTNLPPHIREWGAKMLEDGGGQLIAALRKYKNEYQADNPQKGD